MMQLMVYAGRQVGGHATPAEHATAQKGVRANLPGAHDLNQLV